MNKPIHLHRLLKNLRDYRFRSRFLRNFVVVLLTVTMLCLLIGAVYAQNLLNAAEWVVNENNMFTLRRSADMIDNVMLELRGLTYTLSVKQDIMAYVAMNDQSILSYEFALSAKDSLSVLNSSFDYVDSIQIYSELNGTILTYEGSRQLGEEDQIWHQHYQSLEHRQTRVFFQRKNGQYPYWITIVCAITSRNGTRLGAVVLNLNIQDLGALIGDSTAYGQSLFLVDEDNRLYYSSNFSIIGSNDYAPEPLDFLRDHDGDFSERITIDGESYVVSCINSSLNLWRYVFLSPTAVQQQRANTAFALSRNAFLLIVPLTILVVILLTQRISRPLTSIMSALEDDPTPLDESAPRDSDEIEHIVSMVTRTRRENTRMRIELDERIKQLNNEQIRALQSQIDPHLLYNALDTIRWMSIRQNGGENDVSDMSAALASLLRISLKYDSYLVNLSEEIEHVRMYIKIFDQRYQGRIAVEYDIPEELLSARVIKLSIQPLIENALKHGLRPRRYQGTLHIRAAQVADAIAISVEDDGVGMTEKQITTLNEEMRREREAEGRHIGLLNVNRRIKLIYGSSYGLVLSQRSDGVTVTMVLPLIRAPGNSEEAESARAKAP